MWQSNIHILTTSTAFQEAIKAQSDHKSLRHILSIETHVRSVKGTAGAEMRDEKEMRQMQQISHQINVYGQWSRRVPDMTNEALYTDPF